MDDITIIRWSSVWKHKGRWRVGVRLKDSRDALLFADIVESSGTTGIVYELLIQGESLKTNPSVPDALHKEISSKIMEKPSKSCRSIKNIRLCR